MGQLLVESLDTGDSAGSVLTTDSNQVDFIVDLALTLFDSASCNYTSAWNIQATIDRHQEVLLVLTNWECEVLVHRLSKSLHCFLTQLFI